jgi:uncharacterized protein
MTVQIVRAAPLLFGSAGRELFGMLHLPADAPKTRAAVLLCSPFGQEAIRAHRTFKVLAERLARAGHPALRFDYFGTGDSDGDDSQVEMKGLCADIESADKRLRDAAGDRPVIWLGLGLGATAAWLAAAKASARPDQLILWDPIFDGRRYLTVLGNKHKDFVRESMSLQPRNIPATTGDFEAVGFAVAPGFRADLEALTADAMPVLAEAIRTILVSSRDINRREDFLARRRDGVQPLRHVELPHDIDWLVETIDNGALVPARALQGLLSLVGEFA